MSVRTLTGSRPPDTVPGCHSDPGRPAGTDAAVPPRVGGADRLLAVVGAELARTGKWARWCQHDPRLGGVACLEDAVEGWHSRRDTGSYQVVAALTAIGSRRGGDDDDAAMAVVVLLAPGITRLAAALRDVCEADDVRATVWEEVKRAEPQLGSLAARYLLRRAHQRLTRPGVGRVSRVEMVSLDQRLGWCEDRGSSRGDRAVEVAAPEVEDPASDLADLLTWAREVGVVEPGEVDLIVQLLAAANAGVGIQDAQRLLGQRHGVAMRTIRRRRDATLARLRAAAPDYLAATA